MGYEVRRSVACRQDLDHLFDHLLDSYRDLGDGAQEAFNRAVARLIDVEDAIDALGQAPHQGTLWPEIMDGLRWVTKTRAILYFITNDSARCVDVLAVFYGGQDHRAWMLDRIGQAP
tara:strand:+ start:313 stop:663 length:351 start_codon:yes stop_codon:yes gene_type:complete